MIEAVWIATGVLTGVAMLDKRAWKLLAIMALVVIQTALVEWSVDARFGDDERLIEIAMKMPIDGICGWMALCIATRDRWQMAVPALFVVTLLCHAAYWMGRFNGVDLWSVYPHALNVLWIASMVALALPGGGALIGYVVAWAGRFRHDWRAHSGVVAQHQVLPDKGRYADEGPGPNLRIADSGISQRKVNFVGAVAPGLPAR